MRSPQENIQLEKSDKNEHLSNWKTEGVDKGNEQVEGMSKILNDLSGKRRIGKIWYHEKHGNFKNGIASIKFYQRRWRSKYIYWV